MPSPKEPPERSGRWLQGNSFMLNHVFRASSSVASQFAAAARPVALTTAAVLFISSFAPAPALGQCTVGWLPSAGPASLNGQVRALAVLPNGDVAAGGDFTQAGSAPANHIAIWNGSAWSPLGAGRIGSVLAIAAAPNGDLFAADSSGIARWNGSAWTELPAIPRGFFVSGVAANTMTVMPNGDLYVGGTNFDDSQIIPATYGFVDIWNGTAWSTVGQQLSIPRASCFQPSDPQIPPICVNRGSVNAIAVPPNGNMIVGGQFSFSCCPQAGVAQLNAGVWSPLGTPNLGIIRCLALAPNGDLFAGGDSGPRVSKWDGATWTPLGSGLNGVPLALAALPDGSVIAGGSFTTAGGQPASNIAIWYRGSWYPLSAGVNAPVAALAVSNDTLNVGGSFTTAGGFASPNFARRLVGPPDLVGPDSAVACVGSTPVFSVAWSGQEDCTYAWRHDGQFINPAANPTAETSTLELFVSPFDAGTFDCRVTNSCGSFTSRPASLTVLDPSDASCTGTPCNIDVSDPDSVVACAGETPVFHVDVTGQGPFTYAWRLNEQRINFAQNPSAATDTLALFVQPGDAGAFDCIVTNACHSVTSTIATLTVRDPADPACAASACDPDLNQDGVADQGDIAYLINAVAGGANPTNIDPDFNHDGASDQTDVDALINVVAGGQCP